MIQKQSRDTLGLILYFGSYIFNYFFLQHTSSGHLLNSLFFWDIPSLTLQNQEGKFIVIRSLLAKCGAFIFAMVLATIAARGATKKIAPAEIEDPLIVKLFNRIIQNTLEQGAIFISLYTYFLFDKAGDKFNSNQLLVLASWFIWGRVIFAITYSCGTFMNLTMLRSFGMVVNFALGIMMLQLCFAPSHYLTNSIFSF